MQSYSLEISGVKVNLRKKPGKPIVVAKIDHADIVISIADNIVVVETGEVPVEIYERLMAAVARYYLS